MNPKFKIKINGEERDIKMSFGLLNVLATAVGELDDIPHILLNGELRTDIFVKTVVRRDAEGTPVETLNMFTIDVEEDDVIDLLTWVAEHLTDFFLKSIEKTRSLSTPERMERVKNLMSTLGGGKD